MRMLARYGSWILQPRSVSAAQPLILGQEPCDRNVWPTSTLPSSINVGVRDCLTAPNDSMVSSRLFGGRKTHWIDEQREHSNHKQRAIDKQTNCSRNVPKIDRTVAKEVGFLSGSRSPELSMSMKTQQTTETMEVRICLLSKGVASSSPAACCQRFFIQ